MSSRAPELTTNTHYQRLGVRPSASTEEIRIAYRALARRLHPDALVGGTSAEQTHAGKRMREINEAWQVLQDAGRRRSYDNEVFGSQPVGTKVPKQSIRPADDGDDDLVDVAPEMTGLQFGLFHHLPWVVLVVVFGLIFVVSAYAGSGAKKPADDPALRQPAAGDCVNVKPGPSTTLVPCSGPHELKIVARVDEATPCPPATERRRLGSDGLLDCVSPR